MFIEIEDTHYLGNRSKDFELMVDLPFVIAFMLKSRVTREDLATHLGMVTQMLEGKDVFVLTDDCELPAGINDYLSRLTRKNVI